MACTPTTLLESLNEEQRRAVTTTHPGHTLVLAGAGCGKTSVLTRRIAFLVQEGVRQDRILAVTFTRAASLEMRARIKSLGVLCDHLPPPWITTFHGFGLRLLKQTVAGKPNYVRAGFETEPRLLSEPERLGLLSELLGSAALPMLPSDLLTVDALLERRRVRPTTGGGENMVLDKSLDQLQRKLSGIKRRRNLWEFSDMIGAALDLLENDSDLRDMVSGSYETILVDEFQDTNPLQIRLLRSMLKRGTKLFAVGDDDQAIYGFRGADVQPIRTFRTIFPGSQICKLQTNYRSTPSILLSANRIFRDKELAYRKILRSGRYTGVVHTRGTRPVKKRFPDETALGWWLAETSARLSKTHGVPVEEMAVLSRTNNRLDTVRRHYPQGEEAARTPRFLTIHGAKGLEFPVVFVCGLEESVFPNYRFSGKPLIRTWGDLMKYLTGSKRVAPMDCDLEEERRLFYVAVTRAERFLFLTSVRKSLHFGRTRLLKPSRFLRLI